ncbi:MAG: hypothetical protein HYU64_18925 [Armatimonadetes bacterium]|nr:hypothetical protein [Armatimonadota bacterium]
MLIQATAPTRIDLAGGTLDIHPLYLFEGGGLTLNVAISRTTQVTVEVIKDSTAVSIVSEDLNEEISAPDISSLPAVGPMDLLVRALRFYHPTQGLKIRTRSFVPPGSGLGASSALLIALSGVLNSLRGGWLSPDEIIHCAADIEAQSLGIPTGKQDYYAAVYGGLNAIWFDIGKDWIEPIRLQKSDFSELSNRLILSFTGQSHFSGTNNWNMMKRYIDGDQKTVMGLKGIKETAMKMRQALVSCDFDDFAKLLKEEWTHRRNLCSGVSTDRIDEMVSEAEKNGALASKLCGAGGGGCMITFVRKDRRGDVEAALRVCGAEILDYSLSTEGLKVKKLDPVIGSTRASRQ